MAPNRIEVCRLCRQAAELRQSHIIPKFAIRWMKETGSGYIRRINAPNVRLQDGVKERLLCSGCEQLFAIRERYFSTEVFQPLLDGRLSITYNEHLAYFAASLFWRVVQRNMQEARATELKLLPLVEQAEAEWRQFLINGRDLSRFGHFHLFVADITDENPPGVPKFNLYCSRALDSTLFESDQRCWVIVKFAKFFFVAILNEYDERDWKGTRIVNGCSTLALPQAIEDGAFGGWLMERAKVAFQKYDEGISGRQLDVIERHLRPKLPVLKNSDLWRAAMADRLHHQKVLSMAGKLGRNEKCPCGSSLKFKKCHGQAL